MAELPDICCCFVRVSLDIWTTTPSNYKRVFERRAGDVLKNQWEWLSVSFLLFSP